MTMTFAATLAATHLVLGELLGGARAEAVRTALARAADDVSAAVAAALPRVEALADALAGREHVFVVGSGNATAAAYEAALKLKEMPSSMPRAPESWEWRRAPPTIVGPASVVVALAPAGPGREATLDVRPPRGRLGPASSGGPRRDAGDRRRRPPPAAAVGGGDLAP